MENTSAPTATGLFCGAPAAIQISNMEVFTLEQLQNGAVILHILGILYVFYGIGRVCDLHFMPTLEAIVETLKIPHDVAGATFMAVGTSAPEFFTSIIGIFIFQNDVGIGTIMGSNVLNHFIIIGASCLFSSKAMKLTWFPFVRDTFFYISGLILLIIIVAASSPDVIEWWEALLLLLLFCGYVLCMSRNEKNLAFWNKVFGEGEFQGQQNDPQRRATVSQPHVSHKRNRSMVLEAVIGRRATSASRSDSTAGSMKGAAGLGDVRMEVLTTNPLDGVIDLNSEPGAAPKKAEGKNEDATHDEEKKDVDADLNELKPAEDDDGDDNPRPEPWPTSANTDGASELELLKLRIHWILVFPWAVMMGYSVPDVKNAEGKFTTLRILGSFCASIGWIAILSYLMVDWATTMGIVFGISPLLMGLTVIAFGTSVPDSIASIISARAGHGDAAVSNAIGSCVFNMLIGLGFPWFIQTLIYGDYKVESMNFEANVIINGVCSVIVGTVFACSFGKVFRVAGGVLVTCYVLYVIEEIFWVCKEFHV